MGLAGALLFPLASASQDRTSVHRAIAEVGLPEVGELGLPEHGSFRDRIAIVSPHLDDALLSLGGWILAQPQETHIRIITVCAGLPGYGVPASKWDRLCGFTSANEAVAERRAEDERACQLLGVIPEHLDFIDYPHYGWKNVAHVRERLAATLSTSEYVLSPAAIGGHPDHLVTTQALRSLQQHDNIKLGFYADLPYGRAGPRSREGLAAEILSTLDRDSSSNVGTGLIVKRSARSRVIAVDPAAMREKLIALEHYTSQIGPLLAVFPRLMARDGLLSHEAIVEPGDVHALMSAASA